jgi:hypothetical protein
VHPDRRAIQSLADEVERLHDESMRTLRNDSSHGPTGDDVAAPLGLGHDSRRSFLKKVGIGGAVLTVGGSVLPVGGLVPAAFAQSDDEGSADGAAGREKVVLAQALELAAVTAYGMAADRFEGFGDTASRTLAEQFGDHHQQYADALGTNVLVLSEEQAGEVVADPALLGELDPAISGAGDTKALATVLKDLEERFAATYFGLLDLLTDAADAKAVALMLPVGAQRAVVWSTTLGLDPSEFLLTFQAESDAESFAPTSS